MSLRIYSRPLRTAVVHFVCFTGACAAIAAAARIGIIGPDATKRGLGLCVGGIMAGIGNLLPKLRPLRLSGIEPARAVSAERFAGWTLYLAAVVYMALFGLASLQNAKLGAAIVGIGAIVAIALNWTWLLLRSPLQGPSSEPAAASAVSERRVIASLLFSLVYIVLTACGVYLFGSSDKLALWNIVGFSAAFAVLGGTSSRCAARATS